MKNGRTDLSLRSETADKLFIKALNGEKLSRPPIWLMRQAGRYLPEYRELRAKAGSFLDLCYHPEFAIEVTLQPIRRFGLDAAILFSDILIVPDAMGQKVTFVEGEGPRLEAVRAPADILKLDMRQTSDKFSIVGEIISGLRQRLPAETALIGFCGAPWTVATYMVGGRGSLDQAETRLFAYRDPDSFQKLIDMLVLVSIEYLSLQIEAGAEAVQIFDSWAGNLPDPEFEKWVIKPTQTITFELQKKYPHIPTIGFPRAAGPRYPDYISGTNITAVSCDTTLPLDFIRDSLQNLVPVQGNLDPLLLVTGGSMLDQKVEEIIETLSDGPFVFNLGHGIVPQTPPEHVAQLVNRVVNTNVS
jgi:uroporphyrinogen decarboxylase